MDIRKKNIFPAHLIKKIINRYITGTQSNHHPRGSLPTNYSTQTIFLLSPGKKIRYFIKRYCNDLDIKLVFSSFKIGNLFGVKTLSLTGTFHVWFTSLQVLAVMPVTSAKRAGIFPRVLDRTQTVTGPLTFPNICGILNIVVLCVQQRASLFWITPLSVFNLR